MSKLKKIADEILKDHPGENKVIITQDGQGFFNELAATQHHKRNSFKNEPEVFFREGFVPEDTKELEEDLLQTKETNANLEFAIKQVIDAADLDAEDPEVNGQTLQVVAVVVELREKLQSSIATLKEVAESVNRVCDLENDVPDLKLSDEALPIVKAVIQLRTQLAEASNELATLKESKKSANQAAKK